MTNQSTTPPDRTLGKQVATRQPARRCRAVSLAATATAAVILAACSSGTTAGNGSTGHPAPSTVTSTTTGATTSQSATAPLPSLSHAIANPAEGETTVACYPSRCGVHFQGLTLTAGPVYAFTGRLADGSPVPAFRVDNVTFSTDAQVLSVGGDSIGLTDNHGNKTGEGNGVSSNVLSKSNPACLSTSTPGYKYSTNIAPGYPVTLPKGVCLAFPADQAPVVPTFLLYFDGYPIPLTPIGK